MGNDEVHMAATARKPAPDYLASLDEEPEEWLRLVRSRRIGPTTFHRLMAEHGSATAVLAVLPGIAAAAGVEDYRLCPIEVVTV